LYERAIESNKADGFVMWDEREDWKDKFDELNSKNDRWESLGQIGLGIGIAVVFTGAIKLAKHFFGAKKE